MLRNNKPNLKKCLQEPLKWSIQLAHSCTNWISLCGFAETSTSSVLFNLRAGRLDSASCSPDRPSEPACSLCCRRTRRCRWPGTVWSTSRWRGSGCALDRTSLTGRSCTASPFCCVQFSRSPLCSWTSSSLWGGPRFGAPSRTPPLSLVGRGWRTRCRHLWSCGGSRRQGSRCHGPQSSPLSANSVWLSWCLNKSPPKWTSPTIWTFHELSWWAEALSSVTGWSAAASFLQLFQTFPALKEGWRSSGATWCAESHSWTEAAVKKPHWVCGEEVVLACWR